MCTGDRALQELGALFTVLRVARLKEDNYAIVSRIIFDEATLEKLLGSEISRVVFGVYGRGSISEEVPPILEQCDVEKILADLDDEASNIIKK